MEQQQQLTILDRAAVETASDLVAAYGDQAGLEAAIQAGRSRDLGNLVSFCRWREIERLCDLLSVEEPVGTIH